MLRSFAATTAARSASRCVTTSASEERRSASARAGRAHARGVARRRASISVIAPDIPADIAGGDLGRDAR